MSLRALDYGLSATCAKQFLGQQLGIGIIFKFLKCFMVQGQDKVCHLFLRHPGFLPLSSGPAQGHLGRVCLSLVLPSSSWKSLPELQFQPVSLFSFFTGIVKPESGFGHLVPEWLGHEEGVTDKNFKIKDLTSKFEAYFNHSTVHFENCLRKW